jgi:hypothetical protein
MEQSILESKYNEIVATADRDYRLLVREILADTAAHKAKIAAALAAIPSQAPGAR